MLDTITPTTVGVKTAGSLIKFPEFGATANVGLSAGSATVQLRAWNNSAYKEVLATFVLPVVGGAKAGDMFDSAVIASQWEMFDWNVQAISGGGTLTCSLSGAGI